LVAKTKSNGDYFTTQLDYITAVSCCGSYGCWEESCAKAYDVNFRIRR
jgi:hypothetical protein